MLNRRNVLKATGTAAAGAAGLTAMSGTAAAWCGNGCSYSFSDCPGWFGEIDIEEGNFHEWPWGTDDLTIFIHGFTNQSGGRDYAYEIYRNLRNQGWGDDIVNARWDAGSWAGEWWDRKQHSIWAGGRLAYYLNKYGWTADHGVNVNLIGHSLGGKVALECVRELRYTYGHSINSVQLLGAAVYDRTTDAGDDAERFHWSTRYNTDETHNYHSYNDPVLDDCYEAAEGGRHACGRTGAVGEPWNWYDHDFSDRIHEHCEYMDYDAGVIWWIDDDL